MAEQIPGWAQEIRERVVRIETKLDQYNGIREAAYKAKEQSEDNAEKISDLEEDRKWLWRTAVGAFLVAALNLILGSLGIQR